MRRTIPAALAVVAARTLLVLLAARFGALYRERAGYPMRTDVLADPGDMGLPWEPVAIPSAGRDLPGWFVPGVGEEPRPVVVLIHGWSSNRARMLPFAAFLRTAGFHTLSFDVRGHGENPPEVLPVTAVEFGADALAAVDAISARPGVSGVAVLGHSMGGAGATLAAAARPGIGALVIMSAPADPRLLIRETFRMADLPLPGLVAHPLAWVSLRSLLRPRGHRARDASARRALAAYPGPVLLVQGDADELLPLRDLRLLERAALSRGPQAESEILVVHDGHHRWLYEDAEFRRTVAAFLARHLVGPLAAEDAGAAAAAVPVVRPPDAGGSLIPTRAPRVRRGAATTSAAAAAAPSQRPLGYCQRK